MKMKLFVAVLLGILLTLAFAPFSIFPFAVAAPAGLLYLVLNARAPKKAFWYGFSFGLGLFGSGVYWVFISIHLYGDVPAIVAFMITCGLVAILALFPATTCYLTERYFPRNNKTKIFCAFPALWVAIEWVRSWIFGGFPWLFIGYSQTNSPLKGYAPLLSVYAVSLALLISSGAIVNAYIELRHKNYRAIYGSLLALVAVWTLGGLLSLIHWTKPLDKPITVSLVQGNIPQSLKWSPDHLALSFDRYEQLTKPLWGKSKIIIWPEAAIPLIAQEAESFIQAMDDNAVKSKSTLIFGIPVQDKDKAGFYNTILTVGNSRSMYIKQRLVPFGEFVPLKKYTARIFDFMNVPMSDLLPGKSYQMPLQAGDLKLQASICFEVGFPELVNTNDASIGALLTVTNDAWFGHSIAEAQHLQMAIMRSIELNRPLLFASNNGITAIINADGNVQASVPPYQTEVLTGTVQPMTGLTPWMKNGMDPLLFLLMCLLFVAYRGNKQSIVEENRGMHARTI